MNVKVGHFRLSPNATPRPLDAEQVSCRFVTGTNEGRLCLACKAGLSTERMSLSLAAYDEHNRMSAGGGATHEEERIEVVELSLAELASRADSGRLADMKVLLLVQTLRLRRPDLFRP